MSPLVKIICLISSVVIGAGIAYLLRTNRKPKNIQLALSFSGAFIFGIVFIEILPHVYLLESGDASGHMHGSQIALWILGGFLLQILLDQLTKGVEHGHLHGLHGNIKKAALTVLAGLSIHSFLEGMPLDHNFSGDNGHEHHQFFLAILLHKGTAAFAVALLLFESNLTKAFALLLLFIFSLMTPAGLLLSSIMNFSETVMHILLAIVAGSLLHISTTILFEIDDSKSHAVSWRKFVAVCLGLLGSYGSTML